MRRSPIDGQSRCRLLTRLTIISMIVLLLRRSIAPLVALGGRAAPPPRRSYQSVLTRARFSPFGFDLIRFGCTTAGSPRTCRGSVSALAHRCASQGGDPSRSEDADLDVPRFSQRPRTSSCFAYRGCGVIPRARRALMSMKSSCPSSWRMPASIASKALATVPTSVVSSGYIIPGVPPE